MLFVLVEVETDETFSRSAGCFDAAALDDFDSELRDEEEAIAGPASPSSPSSYSCSYLPTQIKSSSVKAMLIDGFYTKVQKSLLTSKCIIPEVFIEFVINISLGKATTPVVHRAREG